MLDYVPFRFRDVAFLSLAAVLMVSCAHGPRALVSAGGRLDVFNGLDEPVEIFVTGAREALIEPGATAYLDRLPARLVQAHAVGVVTGAEFHRALDLRGSNPARWSLDSVDRPVGTPPRQATGVVILDNRSGEPVRPFLDGKAVELVYPDARTAFSGLPLGRMTIQAVGVRTEFRVSTQVELTEGTTAVVQVDRPGTALRVRNGSDLVVTVHLDRETDVASFRLNPGEARVMRDLAIGGAVQLRFEDPVGRAFWGASAKLEPGQVVDVVVPSPTGRLSVLSEFDQPATILADGRLLGTCPPQGAAEFTGLVPGTARVQAFADDGSVLARTRMRIRPGASPLWFLRPGTGKESGEDEGGLRIINATDEALQIQIDGWDRGRIEPGSRRQFEGLLPGAHQVVAAGLVSQARFRIQAQVAQGARLEWKVLPRNATLALRNLRDETVRILVDDEPLIEVAPGASLDLPVPAGSRRVVATGTRTLASTSHRLDLPASTTTRLDLAPPFASVRVTNGQSQAVEVASDQAILGIVEPGQTAQFSQVSPGPCRLTARSIGMPVHWTILVRLDAGDIYDWNLGAAPGASY